MHEFLSPAWMEAARAIREKYADQATKVTVSIRMNQVITEVPEAVNGGETVLKTYMDTSGGDVKMELGELEAADRPVTTDYATAYKLFVEQDQAAGMQAFMAGKIKVQGDMMKMMAMQTAMPQDEIAKTIAKEIKDITS
ncbi:MAG: SCP2 sterol-binding domain-containing protein [Actinomycetes bacterium]